MKPLVLITYLVLVLAVVGQAAQVHDEATGKQAISQARDVPNRSDSARDTAADRTERMPETEKNRTDPAREEAL